MHIPTELLRFLTDLKTNNNREWFADHKKEFEILVNELEEYNPEMLQKDFIIAISKSDMLDDELKTSIEKELPKKYLNCQTTFRP